MSQFTPVLCGVAQVSGAQEAIVAMRDALGAAGTDSGAPELLENLDAILIPRGTWLYEDPGRYLANEFGCRSAKTVIGEVGISQQGLINEALAMVREGRARSVAIVGGESRRWGRDHEFQEIFGTPDQILARPMNFFEDVELEKGIVFPAARSYAMIERAFSHERGLTEAETLQEISALWHSFNAVASSQVHAAFAQPRSLDDIATERDDNPLISAPYRRWHVSQWTVDQAAALLVTSEEFADELQIERNRLVYPHVAIESSHSLGLVRREALGAWPAMGVLGDAARHHLGRDLSDIEQREIYSCFPAAVRVQASELGLPEQPVPTLTGGMTFFGGPFNSFVLHATVTMADALRESPTSLGLVTGVSGLLTKPALAVWSASPPARDSLIHDYAPEAEAVTGSLDVELAPQGSFTIESSTAFHENGQLIAVLIGRTPQNKRVLIRSENESFASEVLERTFIGETISL